MATITRQRLSSAIANIERHHGPHDPRLPGLRAELVTERLVHDVSEAVSSVPPLSADQRARIVKAVYTGLSSD